MNKVSFLLSGAVAAALLGATALPASAATSGDTVTTFTLTGQGLSIGIQPTATLNEAATGVATVNGSLGNVTVTDLRGSTTAWSATATSTAFTGPSGTTSTGVTYNAGVISTTGVSVTAPGLDTNITTGSKKVAGPTSVVGNNTATWNPTLSVSLPSSAVVGTYTGTVTTSVS